MVNWQVILSRQAAKDAKRISQANLKPQAEKLLKLLAENPYTTPPPNEKLVGNLQFLFAAHFHPTPFNLSCD